MLFWLCMILLAFSFFIRPPLDSALCDFAAKSFECFFKIDGAKEIFDLDQEEAIAVFGEMPQETLV